jgi:hypothetical protein
MMWNGQSHQAGKGQSQRELGLRLSSHATSPHCQSRHLISADLWFQGDRCWGKPLNAQDAHSSVWAAGA